MYLFVCFVRNLEEVISSASWAEMLSTAAKDYLAIAHSNFRFKCWICWKFILCVEEGSNKFYIWPGKDLVSYRAVWFIVYIFDFLLFINSDYLNVKQNTLWVKHINWQETALISAAGQAVNRCSNLSVVPFTFPC